MERSASSIVSINLLWCGSSIRRTMNSIKETITKHDGSWRRGAIDFFFATTMSKTKKWQSKFQHLLYSINLFRKCPENVPLNRRFKHFIIPVCFLFQFTRFLIWHCSTNISSQGFGEKTIIKNDYVWYKYSRHIFVFTATRL